MKTINEKFENLNPEQKREIEEESQLYIEQDPRAERIDTTIRREKRRLEDRGPSAERNLQDLDK